MIDNESSIYQISIALPVPLNRLFDYLSDKPIEAGCRVMVDFSGRKNLVGMAIESLPHNPNISSPYKLKSIKKQLDPKPIVPLSELMLWRKCSSYYFQPLGEWVENALPSLLNQGNEALYQAPEIFQSGPAYKDANPRKNALQQHRLLEATQHSACSRTEFKELGISSSTLKVALEKGWIEKTALQKTPPTFLPRAFELSQAQAATIASIKLDQFHAHLVDGITGSGKTEIYISLIEQCLQQGKQALYLIPEINLASGVEEKIRQRIRGSIYLQHSGLSKKQRLTSWLAPSTDEACIVLGTRTSIFTPMPNLGLIIIDEEHDSAYHQKDQTVYHARNVGLLKAQVYQCPIILGSGTPSLETLNNSTKPHFSHHFLRQKAGNARLSTVRFIAEHDGLDQGGLQPESLSAIDKCLSSSRKAVVFINQRGYANTLTCSSCGHRFECEKCEAYMTLHKHPPALRCHHCDYTIPIPISCPSCKGTHFTPEGLGTQRVEAALQENFPSTPLLRIDRDSTQAIYKRETLFQQLIAPGPCLITGTQMISKGHDIPDLGLVVIIGSDRSLKTFDFRAEEQTTQTLFQVAGRAGRRNFESEVIIQTRQPNHPVYQALLKLDYDHFIKQQFQDRLSRQLPPFSFLALIHVKGSNRSKASELLTNCCQYLCLEEHFQTQNIQIFGPMPAPIERIDNIWRLRLFLMSSQRSILHKALENAQEWLTKNSSGLFWKIEVDPIDLS